MTAIATAARHRFEAVSSSSATVAVGTAALIVCVGVSWWVAAGAAHGPYLLELPTHTSPHWMEGPLRFLGISIRSATLSVGLLALLASYLVALVCAPSLPSRYVVAAVVLANLAFTLGPSIVSTDVFGYIAYAREVVLHGLNPYVSPPRLLGSGGFMHYIYWRNQTSPYGPVFTILSLPIGLLSVTAGLWTYKVAAGVASVALALVAAKTARLRELDPSRAAIFVGLNPVMLFYTVSGAHNDLFAVLFVMCGVLLVLRGREGLGGAAAIAGAAVKVTVGFALPFIWIAARRRGALVRGALVAVVALAIATVILFSPNVFGQLARIVSHQGHDTAWSGPGEAAALLGMNLNTALNVTFMAAAVLVAVVMIVRALRGFDWVTAAGWSLLALVASIASMGPWYFLWALPFGALSRDRRFRATCLVATAYLVLVHVPAFGGVPWISPPATPGGPLLWA